MSFRSYKSWLKEAKEDELKQIFSGAVWSDGEDYMLLSELTPSGTSKIYGKGYDFDFERNTKEEALAQLKKWGYHYIGVD